MKMKKTTLFLLIIGILTFVIHLFLLPKMPDIVPIHWNLQGEVDGYSNKMTTLILAALPLLMLLLFYYMPKLDPRGKNYEKHEKAYAVSKIVTVLFMSALVFLTDAYTLGVPVKINQIVPIGVGILFIVIGNYLPQVRSNFTFGIKTPWTLSDERVWKKTHAMGGIVFCIMGICMMLTGIFLIPWLNILAFTIMFLGVIWTFVYSYLLYRKYQNNGQEP